MGISKPLFDKSLCVELIYNVIQQTTDISVFLFVINKFSTWE